MVQSDIITFITSLYEIDQMIEEKEILALEEDKLINKKLVEQKLLCQHWKFKDVFSKAVSDILPPY